MSACNLCNKGLSWKRFTQDFSRLQEGLRDYRICLPVRVLKQLKLAVLKLLTFRPRQRGVNSQTGQWGESQAAAFLKKEKGMRVLVRNWRHARDELDLVCQEGEVLVFVEVKTRRGGSPGSGYHAVDRRKKRALQRVCKTYMAQLKTPPRHFRFDIVEVISGTSTEVAIHHFENVKLFSKHFHSY